MVTGLAIVDATRFRRDLQEVADKIGLARELQPLVEKLTELYRKGVVKTNHSVMEIVVAGYLMLKNHENIDVEHRLSDILVADVYGEKLDSRVIVEVETGFTPPSSATDPLSYLKARIASKIARYSMYAEKMIIAVPPYYAAPIPPLMLKPPKARSKEEIIRLKKLLDKYYKNPPISLKEIREARLHTILIVDVDNALAIELDPQQYYNILGKIIRERANYE
ncbi:MAG: hypothetical protein ABWW69_06320 [Pyrodictiaceae archaeon]